VIFIAALVVAAVLFSWMGARLKAEAKRIQDVADLVGMVRQAAIVERDASTPPDDTPDTVSKAAQKEHPLPYDATRDEYRFRYASAERVLEAADYWKHPPTPICDDDAIASCIAKAAGRPLEICFTGWPEDIKLELDRRAVDAGLRVRAAVAKNLTFLCVGAAPGPSKLKAAEAQGVAIISGERFGQLIESGFTIT
jgi:NAD-dependent DNA ligase